ncbi:MAG TPA: FG-GAP-like repeat-containing protein, partial [Acidimicrobiales bacterium]|nr:FG-GAP-like repeat-containing protein [Acidimicrobiales bacterium]
MTGAGGSDGHIWIEVYTWNSGTHTFNAPVNTDAGVYPLGGASFQVAFAPFTNGGNTDAAVINAGSVDVLPGNGDGTFGASVSIATMTTGYTGAIAAGDLRGDGNQDLVWENDGVVYVALGHGDGTFAAPVSYPEDNDLSNQDSPARQLLLADLSGQGRLDLVSLSGGETAQGMTVLPGNGDGTFGAPQPYALGQDVFSGDDGWLIAASLAGGPAEDLMMSTASSGEHQSHMITILLSTGGDVGLTASAVASPGSSVTPGQSVTTSWTVTNNGANLLSGPWTDSVYLAPRPVFDPSADRLLGSVTRTAAVGPAGSYSESLTANLPGIPPGTGYLIVVPDSGGRFASKAAGAAASPSFTIGSVPTIAVNGAATTGTIADGQTEYFRVSPQAGIPLAILGKFGSADSASMSETLGTFPDAATGAADQTVPAGFSVPSQLTVTHPDAATYYVMLQGGTAAGSGTSVSLTATQSAFSVTAFTASYGDEIGGGWAANYQICRELFEAYGITCGDPPDTVEISGSGFTPQTTFTLVDPALGQYYGTIATTSVTVVNPTTAIATFDIPTISVPPTYGPEFFGLYKIAAADHGKTAKSSGLAYVYSNAEIGCLFLGECNDAYNGTIQPDLITVDAPDFRSPAPATVTVSWTNRTPWNEPAPLIELEGSNAIFNDPVTGLSTGQSNELLLGVGSGVDAGTLFPGQSGSITLTYTEPVVSGSSFTAFAVDPNYQPGWSQLESSMQPAGIASQAWNLDWNKFMTELEATPPVQKPQFPPADPSMGQFQNLLGDAATYLAQIGEQPDGAASQEIQLEMASVDDFGAISQEFTSGAFGVGHSDPTNLALTVDSLGNVTIHSGISNSTFILQPGGSYIPAGGGAQVLTKEGDGSWQLAVPGGNVDRWSASGQFESTTDPHGNALAAAYNGSGQMTSLTSSLGGASTLAYDSSGHVVTSTAPSGRATTYGYDSSGRMTSMTYGPQSTSFTYGNATGSPAVNEVTSV